jgi:membrane protein
VAYSYFFKNLRTIIYRITQVFYFRFNDDQCFLRASALTYNSALSVVPLFAVMFGIAKGFGIERILESVLREQFHEQPEAIEYLIRFGYTLLEEARGGLIAGVGVIVLLVTVMRLLTSIEDSLNLMWGIDQTRPMWRKAGDYLALILICPILFATSSSLTVYLTTHLETISTENAELNLWIARIAPFFATLIYLIPYIMSAALFTFLYMVMPYAKVRLTSALFAGICAGSLYQVLQATYITIQIQLTRVGAIYGSFAALPLFMVWLYCSWVIFLIGAEIVVIAQERLWDPQIIPPFRKFSPRETALILLVITKIIVDAYMQGILIQEETLVQKLSLPKQYLTAFIDTLVSAKIILRTENHDFHSFVPGRSPQALHLLDILKALQGTGQFDYRDLADLAQPFEKILDKMQATLQTSDCNLPIYEV